MSKLKNCPFCNKQMDTDYSLMANDPTRVICWQCGTEAELSEWDKRPIEDSLQKAIADSDALIERLVKFINTTADVYDIPRHKGSAIQVLMKEMEVDNG